MSDDETWSPDDGDSIDRVLSYRDPEKAAAVSTALQADKARVYNVDEDSPAYQRGLARAKAAMAVARGETPADIEVGAELVHVPDPRFDVVPPGWWQHDALPTIAAIDTWDQLDEAEALIQAAANYIEALGESDVEYRKALRCVEARRGELLGPAPGQGARTELRPSVAEVADVPERTAHRYRQIAEHWETVILPHLVATDQPREVTQTRCLALVRDQATRQGTQDARDRAETDGDACECCGATTVEEHERRRSAARRAERWRMAATELLNVVRAGVEISTTQDAALLGDLRAALEDVAIPEQWR